MIGHIVPGLSPRHDAARAAVHPVVGGVGCSGDLLLQAAVALGCRVNTNSKHYDVCASSALGHVALLRFPCLLLARPKSLSPLDAFVFFV